MERASSRVPCRIKCGPRRASPHVGRRPAGGLLGLIPFVSKRTNITTIHKLRPLQIIHAASILSVAQVRDWEERTWNAGIAVESVIEQAGQAVAP